MSREKLKSQLKQAMDCVQAWPRNYYNKCKNTGKSNGKAILREMESLKDIFEHHHKELLKQDICNFQFWIHEHENYPWKNNTTVQVLTKQWVCIDFYFTFDFPILIPAICFKIQTK